MKNMHLASATIKQKIRFAGSKNERGQIKIHMICLHIPNTQISSLRRRLVLVDFLLSES